MYIDTRSMIERRYKKGYVPDRKQLEIDQDFGLTWTYRERLLSPFYLDHKDHWMR